MIFLNGHAWQEQRRFALRNLRDLGFGKKGMEDLVAEEVEDLCERIEGFKGQYVQSRQFFNKSALRALWKVLTNEDLSVSNSEMPQVWKRMDKVFETANNPVFQVAIAYPWLSRVFEAIGIDTFDIVFKDFYKIVSRVVKNHEDSYQEDNLRDFTDSYLKHRQDNTANSTSSFYGKDGLLNQRAVLNDLMQAGTDTTSITLTWALLFMVENPEIQKKVQEELDDVVGRSRLPCWADRTSTPYTEAALHEVQRCGDIVPNGVGHMTREDTNLAGYFIPKGTQVVPFLSAVLTDPEHFPEPEKFDPTRYITKDGSFEPSPHVIPFGVGKRRCLGETLARMELYRFFTGVLHRFTVEKKPGLEIPMQKELGQASMPARFEVKFTARA